MAVRNLGAVIIDELRFSYIKKTFEKLEPKDSLLDLGCGEKPFLPIYSKKAKKCIGIEVETTEHDQSKVDQFYDGKEIPFKDSSFDYVFSTEVMEHVPNPELFLSEIYRVLKSDAKAILTVPFMVPLHEQPYDFYRYTPYSLKYLIEKSNMEIEEFEVFGDYFAVIISFLVALHLKFWNVVSKKTSLKFLRSVYNPIIFCFIFLPQRFYLFLNKMKFARRLLMKFEYCPKGFGLIIRKKQ